MALLNETQMFARMGVMRGPVVDTVHDFTTMTLEEFDVAYPLWSGGSKRYCRKANGDYVERDTDEAPLTDLGVWIDAAFVNLAPGSLIAGALPGFLNIGYMSDAAYSYETLLGIPGITVTGTINAMAPTNAPHISFGPVSGSSGETASVASIARINNATRTLYGNINSQWSAGSHAVLVNGRNNRSVAFVPGDSGFIDYLALNIGNNTAEDDVVDITFSGYQLVKHPFAPNTFALSSAATTTKTADIIQREVDLRGPFAVEIVATTAPGDPGAHQTYWCESLGANDYAHVYRATSTNQITLKVRANGVDYSVACGAVANSTQFMLRLCMRFNGVDWSLNESTAATLTIKRSAPYIMETLGALWNATLPAWGSVQSIKIAAGKIATAAEIEGGWA